MLYKKCMEYAIWNKLTKKGQAAFGKHGWLNKIRDFTCSLFSPLPDTAKLNEFGEKLSPIYSVFTGHQRMATLPHITLHHAEGKDVLLFSTGEVFPEKFAVRYPPWTWARFGVVTRTTHLAATGWAYRLVTTKCRVACVFGVQREGGERPLEKCHVLAPFFFWMLRI